MKNEWKEIEHQKEYGYDKGNISVRLVTPLKTGGPWCVSMTAFGNEVMRTPFMQEGGLQDAMDMADEMVKDHMDHLKKDRYFVGLGEKG